MHTKFPQRERNSLRFNQLGMCIPKTWEISAPLSVQRYKNEGKLQNKLLFIFTTDHEFTRMDTNIKIKTTTWNNKKNNKNNIISRKGEMVSSSSLLCLFRSNLL